MRAVTIVDQQLEWLEHPDPVPGRGELLIAVHAAGINSADLLQRRGLYPAPPGYPQDIPGMELAGEVVAIGSVATRFAVGDRVMALVGGGAQAELAVVDEGVALAVPGGVAWPAAGGFPEAFATAHDALFTQAHLEAGERVLVTGAAGGVGSAGVQLAATAGAHVVASVRDTGLHDAVAGLGAHEVVVPADAAGHGPYDVVLELVGAASLTTVQSAMAPHGRIVVIGVGGGGARVELDLLKVMATRASLTGSTLRGRALGEKRQVAARIEQAVASLAAGRLTVPIEATYPMAEAALGYERFAAGGKLGKIVLLNG
jgi:NADPH:quinone reductase-like Zn-dependent oxidoreductase